MKIIPFLIAAALTACLPHAYAAREIPTDTSQKAKPATIKVLLDAQVDSLLLEVKGRYSVYNPSSGLLISSSVVGKREEISSCNEGIKWGELFPGMSEIRIVPQDAHSTILIGGIEYKGCIEIYALKNKIDVINEIDIERYLKSTLSFQFPTELNKEVMEAVAILARTNAYYLMGRTSGAKWDVEADEVGYQGHALTLQNIHVDRAIHNTRHLILTFHNAPFATTWTKDSAGKTADFSAIFRKEVATPHGVVAPFAARDREQHSWFFEMSKQELGRIIGAQKLATVDLYQDPSSQRVYALRIKDGTQSRTLDFFTVQNALGSEKLKSNEFTIETQGDKFQFKGYGEGHGVGLCLLSATCLAEKNEKAQAILAQFFPGTQLVRTPTPTEKTTLLLPNAR